jgi:hypothetical protein
MVKRLTRTVPPKSGPMPQGLNISYNTVTTVKQSGEKINGRRQYRQGSSKRRVEKVKLNKTREQRKERIDLLVNLLCLHLLRLSSMTEYS